MAKKGDLRIWWIPQVPGKPFHVPVKSVEEAKFLLNTLADYDKFQLDNNIKPDYSNMGGLEEYLEGEDEEGNTVDEEGKPIMEWVEYHDEEDRCIDEIMQEDDDEEEEVE